MKQHEEQGQQSFVNIKIKTMNQTTYEIIINPLKNIRSFQNQIEQKTKVPPESQRLLFRGFVLDPDKSWADYRIEQGNVVQLVANKIPSEVSHHSSLKRNEVNRNNLYSKQHNKTKKFRQLQQRLNGFRMKKQESLQVIQQNKHTIDQLIQCLNLNFVSDSYPFRLQRRKLEIGQWIDIRDNSGQWIEGQVINQHDQYVLVHYNGWDNKFNQWISASSERIMPFRSHTVQTERVQYMSPTPVYQRQIPTKNNNRFKFGIETMINDLSVTLENLNALIKDLEFSHKSEQNDESLKNVSNISINPNPLHHHISHQQPPNEETDQIERKQDFQTPNKENHLIGDNLSNKCEDDRSNQCDNDDMSSKSFKSKRSEGLVDTASMKSLIIDQSRKRQNKVFFDHTEQAQSVRSVKNKNSKRRYNTINQQYILEEEDSQINDQQFQENHLIRNEQLKRKMKASQLAPLLDRMGRLLIDLAPHVAMLGHTDQSNNVNNYSQNLSTYTNEGSLLSKMSQLNKQGNHHQSMNMSIEEQHEYDRNNAFCYFQVPVMLTPSEIMKLQKVIDDQKKNLQGL